MAVVTWKTRGEVLRNHLLGVYPEWESWPRDFRRVFVLLPSYGADWDGIENMCRDLGWVYESVRKRVEAHGSFSKALGDYIDSGYKYRVKKDGKVFKSGAKHDVVIKWSQVQHVYMIESGITSFIKGEVGKISPTEVKLVEKSRLLDVEPSIHPSGEPRRNLQDGNGTGEGYSEGEASLNALVENIGG